MSCLVAVIMVASIFSNNVDKTCSLFSSLLHLLQTSRNQDLKKLLLSSIQKLVDLKSSKQVAEEFEDLIGELMIIFAFLSLLALSRYDRSFFKVCSCLIS